MFLVPFHPIEGNYEATEKNILETDRGNRNQLFYVLWSCLLTGCGIGKGASGKPAACTISIDCQTILDNIGDLKETKKEFVPEDGWILPEMEVKFTTGDTVFDILKKICG